MREQHTEAPYEQCSQVLNLTLHIEDGFELGQTTGAAFNDLTAAYDTINQVGQYPGYMRFTGS